MPRCDAAGSTVDWITLRSHRPVYALLLRGSQFFARTVHYLPRCYGLFRPFTVTALILCIYSRLWLVTPAGLWQRPGSDLQHTEHPQFVY